MGGKVVAVTGGTGFIGKALVNELLKKGFSVRVLTRREGSSAGLNGGAAMAWRGDLCQPGTLPGFVEGADKVFHLAGEIRNPQRFGGVNVEGTINLLEASKSAGVKHFLYLSSVGVTGASGAPLQVNESTEARPGNRYEKSKYAGELAVHHSKGEGGPQVSILRPSIVFGEGQNPGTDRFLSLARTVQRGHFVHLGERYISSFIYLGDVVAACLTVTDHPKSGAGIFIVNEPLKLTTFINEMAAQLGARRPRVLPRPLGRMGALLLKLTGRLGSLYNRTVFNMDKLIDLGFTLPYGYKEGLARTIDWYHREGLLPQVERMKGSGFNKP
jgi:nucleoside-diphosphate-sugar epimerase